MVFLIFLTHHFVSPCHGRMCKTAQKSQTKMVFLIFLTHHIVSPCHARMCNTAQKSQTKMVFLIFLTHHFVSPRHSRMCKTAQVTKNKKWGSSFSLHITSCHRVTLGCAKPPKSYKKQQMVFLIFLTHHFVTPCHARMYKTSHVRVNVYPHGTPCVSNLGRCFAIKLRLPKIRLLKSGHPNPVTKIQSTEISYLGICFWGVTKLRLPEIRLLNSGHPKSGQTMI